MNLEILGLKEAKEYVPNKKSYAIRIEGSFDMINFFNPLKKSENWVKVNNYYFDDLWPRSWEEYDWVSYEKWKELLDIEKKKYPKMTMESLKSYYESEGHPYGRFTLFDENIARKILKDYEEVANKVENVVIHCLKGENRSPAIGIAMNEIYDWEIFGLKEKFPSYRRYVYDVMMKAGK